MMIRGSFCKALSSNSRRWDYSLHFIILHDNTHKGGTEDINDNGAKHSRENDKETNRSRKKQKMGEAEQGEAEKERSKE
jgi:hypothetical protein